MSVSSATNKVTYNCNGSTTEFDIAFAYLEDVDADAEQIKVTLTDSDGHETELTETTHYTISGGTITTVATYASGNSITISRDPDFTQLVDHVSGGAINVDTLDRALDQLTMIGQFLYELIGRQVKIPITEDVDMTLPAVAQRASHVLGFNASGEPIAVTDVPETATVTTFMETLLDDETAAAARTTLGVGESDQDLNTTDDVEFNNVTGDLTGKADEADGIVETGTNAYTVKKKVLDIGSWDMVSVIGKQVTHGLSLSNILGVLVFIVSDTGSFGGAFPFLTSAGTTDEGVAFDNSVVTLGRAEGGHWDNAAYSSSAVNRGQIIVFYKE